MHSETEELRYERKFLASHLSLAGAILRIKLNSSAFSEIFHERKINNIYLDSPSLGNYFDNVNGNAERQKVRIRWYGALFGRARKPVLEIKMKNGLLGKKLGYPLPDFVLEPGFDAADVETLWRHPNVPRHVQAHLDHLHPKLINCYQRRYYLSADNRFRATLDWNLEFYRIAHHGNAFLHRVRESSCKVLELKYPASSQSGAGAIANEFGFRLTRVSKYVLGMDHLHA